MRKTGLRVSVGDGRGTGVEASHEASTLAQTGLGESSRCSAIPRPRAAERQTCGAARAINRRKSRIDDTRQQAERRTWIRARHDIPLDNGISGGTRPPARPTAQRQRANLTNAPWPPAQATHVLPSQFIRCGDGRSACR
jgi:hypothetical protein